MLHPQYSMNDDKCGHTGASHIQRRRRAELVMLCIMSFTFKVLLECVSCRTVSASSSAQVTCSIVYHFIGWLASGSIVISHSPRVVILVHALVRS